jgi:hypothetical protein
MKYLEKCCKIFLKYKLCILKLLPRGLEVLVQLVENTEIVKPDIHDQGSIPSHSIIYMCEFIMVLSFYLCNKKKKQNR